MRAVRAVLLIGIGIFSQQAFGACQTLPPADMHDPQAFGAAAAHSLMDFQDAQASLSGMASSGTAIDVLSAIDMASEQLRCASDDVGAFSNSDNKAMAATARTLQETASFLIEMNTKAKRVMIAELNGDLKEKPGDHAARMANMATAYRNAWEMLPQAATLTVLALEEPATKNGQKLRLAMTEAQRDSLCRDLLQAFPTLKRRDQTKNLSQVELAAAVLYLGLNQKGWSFRDASSPAGVRP